MTMKISEVKLPSIDRACGRRCEGHDDGREAARLCFSRIDEEDATIHAFLSLDREGALERARKIDARAAAGEALPALAGVPMGIKDVLVVEDSRRRRARRFSRDTAALHRDGGAQAEGSGRGGAGQAELRRVRDGLVERELGVWRRCGIRRRSIACRAGRAADRRRQWRRAWPWQRWARTRADRSGSRHRSAAWWACCRPMGACRATG